MRPALRLLAPTAAVSRLALPRASSTAFARLHFPMPRFFASLSHAGATFDAAVKDLPHADFLRVPESDVLLDARHAKHQVRFHPVTLLNPCV
jgi:hypothetical protein